MYHLSNSTDSTYLPHFSDNTAANPKTTHDSLIDLISRLGLELKKLKALASDDASVITGVNNGVAVQLRENQDLTHMLNLQCIIHCLGIFHELAKET